VRAALPLLALFFASSDALARDSVPWSTPVEVTIRGPNPVRVWVSAGVDMPCNSMGDQAQIAGRFKPGQTIRALAVGDGCVCFQQTYAPFSDTDWSLSTRICTACNYNHYTRVWFCPPSNPDPTIHIKVASSRAS
jgi:hypothetical protein